MTIVEIPLRSGSFGWFETVVIDDVVYRLGFRYNGRMGRWIMDVSDAAGSPLVAGIPLLPSYPLTDKFIGRVPGLPAGQFVLVDETGAERAPGRDDLGADIKLIYAGA
jgi:hypothetical protein